MRARARARAVLAAQRTASPCPQRTASPSAHSAPPRPAHRARAAGRARAPRRDGAQRLLVQCVWNDTLFLAKNNVMDYSLLLGIPRADAARPRALRADGRADDACEGDERGLLVVGVIDYVRQYTVDKLAETVVKSLYDPAHQPTVIEPALYKRRFRDAMDRYFMALPSKYERAP